MTTTIRCTRCGTVTTWTPYCPSCGAYLEFAGDPPWVPALPAESSDADGPSPANADAGGTDAPTPQEESGPATDQAATPPATPTKPPSAPKKAKPPKRRFGGVAPWWRFWGRKNATTPAATAATAAASVDQLQGPTTPDQADETPFTYVVDAPEVPATVSAELPTRQEAVQKRTIPIGRADDLGVPGGMACPQCKFRNYVDSSYCGRCGFTLRNAIPPTQTLASALAPSEKPPRRTDWSFLAIVALVVVLLGILLISPPGQPGRSAIGQAIRTVAYWIDPDLGTPVTFSKVTASSTGYGNPANSMVGDDLTSFWASAPGPSWGAGSTVTFLLTAPARIDRMVIRPGIQNGQFAVRALATPENLTLIFTQLDSQTPAATPSASPSIPPTASPGASPTPSTDVSARPSVSPSVSPSPTASPYPTPTATPSFQASLPEIVEPQDWTSVVTFPTVYTDKIILRLDSVYPPALPDVYAPGGGGQVAITAIQFMPEWTLNELFGFDFRKTAQEVTPTPTPVSSSPPGTTSPSPSPSS